MNHRQPKIGVGVIISRDGKILLGRRRQNPGNGEYSFPGGFLEYGESLEDCVRRETKEETGFDVRKIRFLCISNVTNDPSGHYLDIGFTAEWAGGDPKAEELKAGEIWEWYNEHELPEPLFHMSRYYIEAKQSGDPYIETKD